MAFRCRSSVLKLPVFKRMTSPGIIFSRRFLFRYTTPLIVTSSEISRNRQQRRAIRRSMDSPIIRRLFRCSQPIFFSSRPHWFAFSFNGRDGGRAPVTSGGTGVLHEAKRDPFGPVVNEEVMQRPDSPFPRSFSPIFLPPSPICPRIVVNK